MSWWPGWNSIEGAAKWGDIFFWAGFVFLALLAGCEVLSKVYGWRKDTLIAMRDDLIGVAESTRTKSPERYAGENGAVRAPEVEAARTQAELQSQPEQVPREAEPLARTPEQVARLQERSPRSLTEAQKKTIIGALSQFRGQKFSVVCITGDPEGKSIAGEANPLGPTVPARASTEQIAYAVPSSAL